MPAPACSPDEFAETWALCGGSPQAVADELRINVRGVHQRRRYLETQGYELPTGSKPGFVRAAYQPVIEAQVENGCVVVFSDRHWWPDDGIAPAEAALLCLLPRLNPAIIVANGDVFDGASLSRHSPLGWEKPPTVYEEIAAVQAGMRRIADACPTARKIRTVGNHDRRADYYLAQNAPMFRDLAGFRLRDHLPDWEEAWTLRLNRGGAGDAIIKHKEANGVHAAHTNAMKGGITIVTGHSHKLQCRAFQDYRGRRWGVECGMLGHPRGPATEYAEQSPDTGCGGFVVLTWVDGVLQPPELAETDEAGVTWFRGRPVALRFRVRAGSRAA